MRYYFYQIYVLTNVSHCMNHCLIFGDRRSTLKYSAQDIATPISM